MSFGNIAIAASAGTGKTHTLVQILLEAMLVGSIRPASTSSPSSMGSRDANADSPDMNDVPAEPSEIVATTFSVKAAEEIRERLSRVLDEIAAGNNRRYALAGDATTLERRALKRKQTLDRLRIGTIHSVAGSLLRELLRGQEKAGAREASGSTTEDGNAVATLDEDDWSADFHILREGEASELLHDASSDALSRLAERDTATVGRLLGHAGGLEELLACIETMVRDREERFAMNDGACDVDARIDARLDEATIAAEWQTFVNIIEALAVDSRTLSNAASRLCATLVGTTQTPSTATGPALAELFSIRIPGKNKTRAELDWHQFVACLTGKDKSDKGDRLLERVARSAEFSMVANAVYDLVIETEQTFRRALLAENAMSFGTLLRECVLRLEQNPDARARIAGGIRLLLIDEAQDTSPLQARLIGLLRPIASDPSASARRSNEEQHRRSTTGLVVVGDRKQSIYGFRGADVAVFAKLAVAIAGAAAEQALGLAPSALARAPASGELRTLKTNFRSAASILTFVNTLGPKLFRPSDAEGHHHDDFETVYTEADQLRAKPSSLTAEAPTPNNETDAARVPFVVGWDCVTLDKASTPRDELRATVSWIVHLIRDCGKSANEIAVLGQSNTFLQMLAADLALAGIPYTLKGTNFFASKEARDIRAILAYLDNPNDALARYTLLRGPLASLLDDSLTELAAFGKLRAQRQTQVQAPLLDQDEASDEDAATQSLAEEVACIVDDEDRVRFLVFEQAVRHARSKLGTDGPMVAVLEVLRSTDARQVYLRLPDGPRRWANVSKAVAFLTRFANTSRAVRFFDRARHERESDAELDDLSQGVMLLTAHGSKGLSFPIVLLPQVGKLARPNDPAFVRGTLANPGASIHHDVSSQRAGRASQTYRLCVSLRGAQGTMLVSPAMQSLVEEATRRERAERQRVWYVACTRAESHMLFIGNRTARGSQSPFSATLQDTLENAPSTLQVVTTPTP
jgi:ATP-dependent helicase/nuclease subunit A